jgi:hypothetical protein
MLRSCVSFALATSLVLDPAVGLSGQSSASAIESARKAYWEGRFEASLDALERLLPSLRAESELRDAHFLIGLNQLAFARTAEARKSFRAAVAADPSFVPSEELYPPDVVSLYRDVRGESTETREKAPQAKAAAEKRRGAPQSFDDVKLLLSTGGETKETEAILSLGDEALVVKSRKEAALLKEIAYDDIKSAQYTYSRHPRWKEGAGFAVAVGVFAAPIFFMKGKKHWLTIQTADDYALLRLDKNSYQIVILALETKGGIEVAMEGES